ncbi:MAG: alpha/beta fold hydrolase [Acidimicrobiales bacterium]
MTITERTIRTNGIDLHVAEAGDGPLVVLAHGFPELAYSWRHQLPALAAAGYHAVAPDQRGYGRTSRPDAIEAYDIVHLTDDLLGLVDALGHDRAAFVGHDWGANVVWAMPLLAPERVKGVAGLSVPFVPRGSRRPTETMRYLFGDTWFYMLYFQEPGVADADLGHDPATTMRRVLGTNFGRAGRGDVGEMLGPRDGKGFVERLPEPESRPEWLTPADLDHFVAEFTRTGFTGGLNWYRNLDRNWELMADVDRATVEVPALFLAGRDDPVLMMLPPAVMDGWVSDLRATVLIDGAGHWVQQERPDEVNAALLDFLKGLV